MTSHICSLMKLKTFGVPSQRYKCYRAHRSMVAWCMGVVPVPDLTAVNGPFLRECKSKLSTGTVVLRGSLTTEKGYDVTLDLCSNKLRNIWSQSDSTSVGVYSLRISQLFACCLGVLMGPAVPTNTPPTCAGTVHLQDVLSWRETHCREGGEKRSHCFFQGLLLCLRWQSRTKWGLYFTWEGRVDRKAWHTSNFILSSFTVINPVTGLV